MGDMLRELCIMSVICAIACSLSPEGPIKRLLGVCCSVILMLTALKPIGEFDIENFAGFQAKYRELESFLHEDTEIISSSLNRLVIEEEYRTYIMDKAEKEFGEIAKDLEVVGEGIGVTIRCQRAEIFEKMHRL